MNKNKVFEKFLQMFLKKMLFLHVNNTHTNYHRRVSAGFLEMTQLKTLLLILLTPKLLKNYERNLCRILFDFLAPLPWEV